MDSDNKPLLTQKEYLKRYLSKDKVKKKKKKPTISSSSHLKRSVIIDDDLGLKDVANIDDEEFNLDYLGDEAPQIVGIIDERPNEIRAKEKYDNNLWRTVGETNNGINSLQDSKKHPELSKFKINSNYDDSNYSDSDHTLSRQNKNKVETAKINVNIEKNEQANDSFLQQKKYHNDTDFSAEKSWDKNKRDRGKFSSDSDLSPDRNHSRGNETRKQHLIDSDLSPGKNNNKQKIARKKYNNGSDLSPERIRDKKKAEPYSDSDMSPERCNRKKKEKSHSDSDMSPPRPSKIRKKSSYRHGDVNILKNKETGRAKTDFIPSKINHNFDHHYKERKKTCNSDESDTDPSRTKKLKHENKYKYRESEKEYQYKHGKSYCRSVSNQGREDSSRHRDIEKRKTERSSSHSRRKHDDRELTEKTYKSSRSNRTEAKKGSDSDLSPSRNKPLPEMKRVKSISRAKEQEKMQDGKKSGLQVAENLKEELKRLKANEDKMFKKMDPSLLGASAAPIQRDRKTGMVRQIEKEKEEERMKAEKRAKTESKYYRWGKGLKQMEDKEDRIADAIREMSKPLARYRDDKDLDAYLRAQEREGDPMLDYIKNKQAESHNVIDLTVGSSKPMYNGSYMPNRFGIRPGYRWDGVDRSNGYEKKWFEQKNARKATEEAAYKWSTSDM